MWSMRPSPDRVSPRRSTRRRASSPGSPSSRRSNRRPRPGRRPQPGVPLPPPTCTIASDQPSLAPRSPGCTLQRAPAARRPDGAWSLGSRNAHRSTDESYPAAMPIQGEYEPSAWDWVRDQVAEYEASGGERANTLLDTGLPVIVVTTRGNKSGKVRKMAMMRVEHDGESGLVAPRGGMPTTPSWYYTLTADPTALVIQDGPELHDFVAREVTGDEKVLWWERAVAAY